MPIYFSWDIEKYCSDRLKIFQLIISQREGEVALAKLQILAEEIFHKGQDYKYIIYQNKNGKNHLLFKGKPIGFPRQISNGLVEIELSAEPEDAFEHLKILADSLKTKPYFDE